jgi:ketosteroid isomerase-like protein
MERPKAVPSLLIAILCGACATQPPPPAVDLEAEEQQIRQLAQDWFEAENRKDLDAIMEFVAERVVVQVPGVPIIEGKAAMRDFMAPVLESLVSITGGPMTVVVSEGGDMAYQFGTGLGVFEGPEGQFEDPQKYLFAWQKIDGEWKAVAGSFSSDVAM